MEDELLEPVTDAVALCRALSDPHAEKEAAPEGVPAADGEEAREGVELGLPLPLLLGVSEIDHAVEPEEHALSEAVLLADAQEEADTGAEGLSSAEEEDWPEEDRLGLPLLLWLALSVTRLLLLEDTEAEPEARPVDDWQAEEEGGPADGV